MKLARTVLSKIQHYRFPATPKETTYQAKFDLVNWKLEGPELFAQICFNSYESTSFLVESLVHIL